MKIVFAFLLTAFMASTAVAGDFALGAGFRNTNVDSSRGVDTDADNGFLLGGLGFFELGSQLDFRTGLFYSQRNFKVADNDGEFSYIDVPLTLRFNFSDFGGVFAGIIVAMNQNDDINDRDADGESMILPFTLGLSFKFAPQLGAELFYEMYGGEIAENLEDMNSIGAMLTIYFE